MAIRLTADKPEAISFTASLDSQVRHSISMNDPGILELNGVAPVINNPWTYDESENPKPVKFAARIKVIADGGKISGGAPGSCPEEAIVVENADSAIVLLATGTSFVSFDRLPDREFLPEIRNIIERAAEKGYDKLFARHVKDYENLFGRVKFDLGNGVKSKRYNENYVNKPTDIRQAEYEALDKAGEPDLDLIALYFQYGRYLLISSSRGWSFAANLQGIWCDLIHPPWSCNLTVNINTEMNYWLAENTNLSECHRPLFHLLNDLAKHGTETARVHYGCRGFTAAHNVDVWAHSAPATGNAVWSYWSLGGAWMALHIFDRYLFTKDHDFLKRYYPVLHDAALFCYDWLYFDKEYNKYMTSPATSPENMFLYIDGNGEQQTSSTSKGSASDMAVIRQLFEDTIKAAEILGTDTEFAGQLKERLENLFPYQISPESGRLMEWYKDFADAEPGHRHLSHLIGLYPGNHITKGTTPELFEAVRKALEIRLSHGSGHTGWSCSWVINLFARLKNGGRAYDYVRQLLTKSTYPNLFDAHPPFQIDGNFGGTAGIAEMLLQSHEEFIELLPALPDIWEKGCIKGLRARGGVTADISWENNKLIKAVFYTEEDINSIKVRYNGKDYDVDIAPFEKNIFKII
jgi:alpha-L-fucosidase 2